MSDVKDYNTGSVNPHNLYDTLEYKLLFARDNPDFFYPCGIWLYCGSQGDGKTLSLVNALIKVCKDYPKALICTNLELHLENFDIHNEIVQYTDYEQLMTMKNGIFGIIFVLDEIQVIYNYMESKGVPVSELACFCQNRKDRRLIMATSQRSNRVKKEIREQTSYLIECRNYFQAIQHNKICEPDFNDDSDGKIHGNVISNKIWFHSPKLYKAYDTYSKIEKPKRSIKKVVAT